jgi:hypothetical protein
MLLYAQDWAPSQEGTGLRAQLGESQVGMRAALAISNVKTLAVRKLAGYFRFLQCQAKTTVPNSVSVIQYAVGDKFPLLLHGLTDETKVPFQ